jgi:hypothetical protein
MERQRDEQREAELRRERAAFAELCATVGELVAALPAEVGTALHEEAARTGPFGRNRPGQPIYTQMLAHAYTRWRQRST